LCNEIKQKHKKIIENFGVDPWIKEEIINVLDIQISALPILDQKQYTILINSVEHPDGYKLDLTAHPTLRIRSGKLIRDPAGNPDSFFWDEATYEKNKSRSTYFLISGETGEYLENYFELRKKIISKEDGEQLSFKVASRKWPLEVMITPAEQRTALEVTEEVLERLPALLESYNDIDPTATVKLAIGDLLVLDKNGFYYRVAKDLKEQTYCKGVLKNGN
jgi:hypothetical protein